MIFVEQSPDSSVAGSRTEDVKKALQKLLQLPYLGHNENNPVNKVCLEKGIGHEEYTCYANHVHELLGNNGFKEERADSVISDWFNDTDMRKLKDFGESDTEESETAVFLREGRREMEKMLKEEDLKIPITNYPDCPDKCSFKCRDKLRLSYERLCGNVEEDDFGWYMANADTLKDEIDDALEQIAAHTENLDKLYAAMHEKLKTDCEKFKAEKFESKKLKAEDAARRLLKDAEIHSLHAQLRDITWELRKQQEHQLVASMAIINPKNVKEALTLLKGNEDTTFETFQKNVNAMKEQLDFALQMIAEDSGHMDIICLNTGDEHPIEEAKAKDSVKANIEIIDLDTSESSSEDGIDWERLDSTPSLPKAKPGRKSRAPRPKAKSSSRRKHSTKTRSSRPKGCPTGRSTGRSTALPGNKLGMFAPYAQRKGYNDDYESEDDQFYGRDEWMD